MPNTEWNQHQALEAARRQGWVFVMCGAAIFVAGTALFLAADPGQGRAKDASSLAGSEGLLQVGGDLFDHGFEGWTQNPGLGKELGGWQPRTFCWGIGFDCPDDLKLSRAAWDRDGDVELRAEDDNTHDLGCDCAAMTQGTGFDGSVRGRALERVRTGDLESAYVILRRSGAGAKGCRGVSAAGNIINLWLRNEQGAIWVIDLYFETEGLDSGFKERAGPHNKLVTWFSPLPWERGHDWYAYQFNLARHPAYYRRDRYPDGSEQWVIDLKSILERGARFSHRDLDSYSWWYVELVSEDVCVGGKAGQSASWQKVNYFEIKVKKKP